MAASNGPTFSRKRETPSERAQHCTDIQRELKKSAAESRERAAAAGDKPAKRVSGARKY